MNTVDTAHHWSGWPQAFCLKCGIADPTERAVMDNKFSEVTETSASIWAGTEQEWRDYCAKLDCPVLGELRWDTKRNTFVLIPPKNL